MSDNKLARIAGALYLVVIITGLFAEVFVRQKLVVSGNAVATADNIRSATSLYRLGFVADLVNFILGLPCVLIIYILFKKVNRHLAMLAIILVVVQTAIIAVNLSGQASVLLYLEDASYLDPFHANQLAALSYHNIRLQSIGYGIGLVFFGCYCIIIGYLIYLYELVPRIIGILYGIGGVAYLVNSFTMFLSPQFANPLFPLILLPPFVGEVSLCLWLLFRGIKLPPAVRHNL
jgi:hypothetical protein